VGGSHFAYIAESENGILACVGMTELREEGQLVPNETGAWLPPGADAEHNNCASDAGGKSIRGLGRLFTDPIPGLLNA